MPVRFDNHQPIYTFCRLMIRSFIAVIGSLLTCAWLGAQETLAVRALALSAVEMPDYHVMGTKEQLPVKFSDVQPGDIIRALAANPLPLYLKKTDAQGKVAWVAAEKVKIPAGSKGILLLAIPDGEQTRLLAIEDDFSGARYNDWLLINGSSKPIAFAVGKKEKPVLIAAGTSVTHRVSTPSNEGATVMAQAPIYDKPTVFLSTYWPVYDDRRTVVLFVDSGPKILVKRIADILKR